MQDFKELNEQLAPFFKKAVDDMIIEGVHSQAPHFRLKWLSNWFQSEADSAGSGQSVAAADSVVISESALPDAAAGRSPPQQSMIAESPIDYAKHMALSAARHDEAHMQAVFNRHTDVAGGLSKTALMAALKEIDAPVLSSSDGASEDSLFRRADTKLSGYVNFSECAFPTHRTHRVCSNAALRRFMLVASLPDDLEMFLADHGLRVSRAFTFSLHLAIHSLTQFVAPALRAHAPSGTGQLGSLASMTSQQINAATAASATSLREQLHKVQQLLQEINQAQEALLEQASNTKYQIKKMEVGSITDFHEGLIDRIGACSLVCGARFLM